MFANVKTMNVCKYTLRWLLSMRKFELSRLMVMGESKDVFIVFNQSVILYVESVRHCALTWCTCSSNIHSIGTLLRLDNVFLCGDERRVSWITIVYAICMVLMRVVDAPRMHVSLPSHRHKCFAMHWLRICTDVSPRHDLLLFVIFSQQQTLKRRSHRRWHGDSWTNKIKATTMLMSRKCRPVDTFNWFGHLWNQSRAIRVESAILIMQNYIHLVLALLVHFLVSYLNWF